MAKLDRLHRRQRDEATHVRSSTTRTTMTLRDGLNRNDQGTQITTRMAGRPCAANLRDMARPTVTSAAKAAMSRTTAVMGTNSSATVVVSSKQRHALSGAINIDVHLGNENIKQIDCIDYLGVKLDAHLTWNDQIDAVCKKLVFIISRLSRL